MHRAAGLLQGGQATTESPVADLGPGAGRADSRPAGAAGQRPASKPAAAARTLSGRSTSPLRRTPAAADFNVSRHKPAEASGDEGTAVVFPREYLSVHPCSWTGKELSSRAAGRAISGLR